MPYIDSKGKSQQVLVTYTKILKGEEVTPPVIPPCPHCSSVRHRKCCRVCKKALVWTKRTQKYLGGIFCSRECSTKSQGDML